LNVTRVLTKNIVHDDGDLPALGDCGEPSSHLDGSHGTLLPPVTPLVQDGTNYLNKSS
jgi:hypothetical protein